MASEGHSNNERNKNPSAPKSHVCCSIYRRFRVEYFFSIAERSWFVRRNRLRSTDPRVPLLTFDPGCGQRPSDGSGEASSFTWWRRGTLRHACSQSLLDKVPKVGSNVLSRRETLSSWQLCQFRADFQFPTPPKAQLNAFWCVSVRAQHTIVTVSGIGSRSFGTAVWSALWAGSQSAAAAEAERLGLGIEKWWDAAEQQLKRGPTQRDCAHLCNTLGTRGGYLTTQQRAFVCVCVCAFSYFFGSSTGMNKRSAGPAWKQLHICSWVLHHSLWGYYWDRNTLFSFIKEYFHFRSHRKKKLSR